MRVFHNSTWREKISEEELLGQRYTLFETHHQGSRWGLVCLTAPREGGESLLLASLADRPWQIGAQRNDVMLGQDSTC